MKTMGSCMTRSRFKCLYSGECMIIYWLDRVPPSDRFDVISTKGYNKAPTPTSLAQLAFILGALYISRSHIR